MLQFAIDHGEEGQRLDHVLTRHLPDWSRARLQQWVDEGRVRVSGLPRKSSYRLRQGESIEVEPAEQAPLHAFAEEIPLEILFEDPAVVAVNKPSGMVVHAGAGQHSGTLVNALLHRFEHLSNLGGNLRPGIVHRLDKGTSGVLLVAKTDAAHRKLAAQFADREVTKVYIALVCGVVKNDHGIIDRPITRDPVRRTRMTAKLEMGRSAYTEYRVLERLPGHTLLEVDLGTGRTHQIRVHLASVSHPIAGDTLYGAPSTLQGRPFLHAKQISFCSPATDEPVTVEAPLPADLIEWLDAVRSDRL